MTKRIWKIYLYKHTFVVPRVLKASAGFWVESDPCALCDSTDAKRLRQGVLAAIDAGNPVVPTPSFGSSYVPAVVQAVSERTWSRFAQKAFVWDVLEEDGRWEMSGVAKANVEQADRLVKRTPIGNGLSNADAAVIVVKVVLGSIASEGGTNR